MKKQLLCAAAVLLFSAGAGMAATSDIVSHRRADFFAPGKHQFYAWCMDGKDRLISQNGLSAKDAETKLAGKTGACRLVWQGRILA